MSRAKTVCLSFRDFLNGPVHFQVPQGYRRLQLNHFSVAWETRTLEPTWELLPDMAADLTNIASYLRNQYLFNVQDAVNSVGLYSQRAQGPDAPQLPTRATQAAYLEHTKANWDDPPAADAEWQPVNGFDNMREGQNQLFLQSGTFTAPTVRHVLPEPLDPMNFGYRAPGSALGLPWLPQGTFPFPPSSPTAAPLTQRASAQIAYATMVPSFVQLNCTGLGAWRDTVAMCPYPGHLEPLGMQGNTYEITNPSLTFTVLDDAGCLINNVTLVVQFTLL